LANAAAIVPYLICAAELVQAAYGALDVPWGAVPNGVHNIVLATHDPTFETTIPLTEAPQSGADDPFARCVSSSGFRSLTASISFQSAVTATFSSSNSQRREQMLKRCSAMGMPRGPDRPI
jgi:hypothetical protein